MIAAAERDTRPRPNDEMMSTRFLPAERVAAAGPLTRRQLLAALLICAAPLGLLPFSIDWLLTPIGYIDPWHYVGFFHFYEVPGYSENAYKLARLPWILAGWAIHHLLPSLAAAIVLHATFLIAATAGMFLLAWLLFDSYEVALVGALIVGFHPAWHGSGGWDYHNTAAGAFYLWSLATVTMAARRPSAIVEGIAGVVAALAVHSNITYGCFLPILGLHYVALSRIVSGRWPRIGRIVRAIACGTLGAVLITAGLSAINVLAGREAMFFSVLADITLRYTMDLTTYNAAWWHPWSTGWFWRSYHLALPVAAVVLSPLIWFASRSADDRHRKVQRLVLAEFIIMAFVWSAWQFAGNLTLDWDYFFFPLLPHVLLAVVALISATTKSMHWGWVVGNALLLLGSLGLGLGAWFSAYRPLALTAAPMVVPAAMFVVAGLCTLLSPRWRTAAFAVVFSAANALSSGHPLEYAAWSPCHINADTYDAVVDSAKAIQAKDPPLRHTRMFFDEQEWTRTRNGCTVKLADFGYSLGGIPVAYFVDPFPMPAAERLGDAAFTAAANDSENSVVVLSSSQATLDRFLRAAADAGVEGTVVSTRRHFIDDAKIDLTFLRMRNDPEIARQTAALPGVTLVEWTSNDLAGRLGVNTYAEPRREVVQRRPGGEVLFLPATSRDHLASDFMSVPTSNGPRSLVITSVAGAPPPVRCAITVQDQGLKVLGQAPCGRSTGDQRTVVKLPASSKQVRITFQATDKNPMVLPQRLTITEHDGVVSPAPKNASTPAR